MILKILARGEDIIPASDYLGLGFKTSDTVYNMDFVGNLANNSNFKHILPKPELLQQVRDIESIYIDEFSNIYEIPLLKEPNQSFDIYVNNTSFNFDLKTTTDEQTFISIWQGRNIITEGANVSNTAVNLAYFSNHSDGVFFFLYAYRQAP